MEADGVGRDLARRLEAATAAMEAAARAQQALVEEQQRNGHNIGVVIERLDGVARATAATNVRLDGLCGQVAQDHDLLLQTAACAKENEREIDKLRGRDTITGFVAAVANVLAAWGLINTK